MRPAKFSLMSEYGAMLRCRDCTIYIGGRHVEAVPQPSPDGVGVLCSSCRATLRRRMARGPALGEFPLVERLVLKPEDRPSEPGVEDAPDAGWVPADGAAETLRRGG